MEFLILEEILSYKKSFFQVFFFENGFASLRIWIFYIFTFSSGVFYLQIDESRYIIRKHDARLSCI